MDGPGSSSKLGVGSGNGVAVVDSTCFRAGGGVDVWDWGETGGGCSEDVGITFAPYLFFPTVLNSV